MKIKYVILGLVVIGAVSFAVWKNQQLQAEELVGIAAVNGRLELKRLDVATLYPGRVEEILVQEGDEVKINQPLARLSSTISQTQVSGALAQKKRAEETVSRALAEIDARQQQAKVAKLELDNAFKLRRDNLISSTELERRQSAYNASLAAVNTTQAAKAEAEAAVAQAKAQLEKAQSQYEDMIIKAPKDGRLEYQIAEVGNVLGAGGKVVSVLDPTDTYINVFLTAQQMNQIKLGDDARIVIDGINAVFPAKITFVANNAQFTPKSVETTEERAKLMFKVKLQIPVDIALKYKGLLKGGMTAIGYVKYDPQAQWVEQLDVKLPQGE
ncbi:HlyD family secretion protein [Aggregatibacter aphrophilus]|uniref:Putative efflux pump membrane fusion protein n=2 Tax=Aggregatibacter aphrophilus TaxID=732 RepID=A0A336N6I8_AGGAP|nr:HlyD family efflux transporter periplasmic adaptor subunit [Aggregatibacter aphrophilus]OBY55309.1 hemolysin D [Aggregatibacter aphrophilus]RDE89239.1 HlyD family efflux transporter periplasmic adaptor subunit [Aggregatibacter aphrophilus]RDE92866.1 HlyD family efflux transporter periplasmic adaptor subunit [Aggregatibacter aphrophilus]SQI98679.1 putative efflux pump membrane fusion protein [Aggregatibacter aphrophilus]SSZ29636.1 putative efflux pump membrane fusion protein [Aggregatibacter